MTSLVFSKIVSSIPKDPGIYKYFDDTGELLYVGKAKNIKKRVSSYFNKTQSSQKTIELVKRIHRIEFTIVNSEEDAFLLESTLIKENQPHYNINLKDDKGYPYLVVKNEAFPRVFFSHKKFNDGSQYFGPYTFLGNVKEMLSFVKQEYPFRTCQLNLSQKNIVKGKYKVCLEYHIGNCKGPCQQFQFEEEYQKGINQLISLLKGNLAPIFQQLKQQVKDFSINMEFEKAAATQDKINHLLQYQKRSAVVNINTGTLDVFTIVEDNEITYINYLGVNNGCIIYTKTISLEKKLDESSEQLLQFAIELLRLEFKSEAKEIILPFEIELPYKDIKITIPKAGDKKTLLELSQKNASHFKFAALKKKVLMIEQPTTEDTLEVLENIKDELQLTETPTHIECFDNSNLHGTNPVAAMVCFKNGVPSKKDYRRFTIKTVEGINDFASMKEIVFRRYKRVLEEQLPLPQLIIIDGGKGQLGAAMESIMELEIQGKVTVVGLAKSKEEIFFPGNPVSLELPWESKSLNLIRFIRDEVHRFGITFHRLKRSKSAIENELEKIVGIGKATSDLLLQEYKSVKKIKSIPLTELEKSIGKAKAAIVFNALHL